jgi:hypothetical protein
VPGKILSTGQRVCAQNTSRSHDPVPVRREKPSSMLVKVLIIWKEFEKNLERIFFSFMVIWKKVGKNSLYMSLTQI